MRLTKKEGNEYFLQNVLCENGMPNVKEHAEKLGQLEDIEDELCIDLITLFKALKNGIVDKKPLRSAYSYTKITPDRLSVEYKNKCLRKRVDKYYFKDYGKTWALDKKELEKGE